MKKPLVDVTNGLLLKQERGLAIIGKGYPLNTRSASLLEIEKGENAHLVKEENEMILVKGGNLEIRANGKT